MAIELACTGCSRTLRVADDAAGKHARCPACGTVSLVPAPPGASAGSAPVAAAPHYAAPSSYGDYAPPQPEPLANPFAEAATAPKPSPYGQYGQGVNPFGDYGATKETGNPYQTPAAYGYAPANRYQHQLASRGKRFVGAVLDGLFHLLGMIPGGIVATIVGASTNDEDAAMTAFFLVGLPGVFLVAIANWVLIARTGQSFAKRILGMKIVRIDVDQPVGFVNGVVLRSWVPALINQVCNLFGLIDALWIFNEERRCIHDLIAQTIVIDV